MGAGVYMQHINFKLWRAAHDHDWSVEVNGSRYESVPVDLIKQLVQHAILDAEDCLIQTTIQ
jgi:hypothetical protein